MMRAWAEKDYGKSFRSRPGSADWKPRCECGWVGTKWMYEQEAKVSAQRHLEREHSERSLRGVRTAAREVEVAQAALTRAVDEARQRGHSLREIASAAGVSHEQIRRIARR